MQHETKTRRQREEKLIADFQYLGRPLPSDCKKLAAALKAAHAREDAIRKSLENGVRFDGMSPVSCRELLEKLDAT